MAGDGVFLVVLLGCNLVLWWAPQPLFAWETSDRVGTRLVPRHVEDRNVSTTTLPLCTPAFLRVITASLQPWAKVLRAAQGGQDRGGLQ